MSNVPLYVYALFAGLMYWGYKCCFSRVMRIERLMLLPLLACILSFRTVLNLFHMGLLGAAFWFAGASAGLFPGHLYVRGRNIQADHDQKLISVPGDWTMLVLIFAIFLFEFFVHYSVEAGWPLAQLYAFKTTAETVLGFIAGMAIGRNLTYSYKYANAPNVPLAVLAYGDDK